MGVPLISIVIIARSDPHLLHLTFDSLFSQGEKNFEVILLDAIGCSSALKRTANCPALIQEARRDSLAQTMNQGLFLARGTYVQFLFPGDRLLSQHATEYLGQLAADNHQPDVIYCSYLLRDPKEKLSAITLPLTLELLQKGLNPTLAQAYWFLKKTVQENGGFTPHCHYRPSFDFLCRILVFSKTRVVCTRHVLTDCQWQRNLASERVGYAWETCRILYRHYGLWHALRWLFVQDHLKLLRGSWKGVKQAFWKGN